MLLRKMNLRFAQCVLSMHAGGMVGANLIKPEMKASLFDARTCLTFLAFFCCESPSEKSVGCIFSVLAICDVSIAFEKTDKAFLQSFLCQKYVLISHVFQNSI